MKKILLSILFIVSLSNVFAQTKINRAGAANTVTDQRLAANLNLFTPVYADTTQANNSKGIDSCYALIATRDVNGYWMRQCSPKKWVRVASTNIVNNSITNISVINVTDSSVTISICTGDNSCDTTTINNVTIENPTATQTVELINDTTLVICDSLANCDTAIISPQQFLYFFQNVLTQISPGVVEFGGELLHTTTITFGGQDYVIFYTSGDFGLPLYPNTRNDGAQINVLATTSQGVVQSMPFVNTIRNGIIYGGIVTWSGTGYSYNISAAGYYLNGVFYTSNDTTVILSAADSTYDRIDVFVLNESGQAEVVEGTPAPVPSQPSVDPATQLGAISFGYVTANTTEPQNITSECAYTDGGGWTATSSNARINVASTNAPCGGAVGIEGTSVVNNDLFTLTRATAFDPRTNFTTLTFQIKSKGDWGNAKQLRRILIYWRDGTNLIGSTITLGNGSYGFNSNQSSTCQNISIPLSNFALPSSVSLTQLRFVATANNGSFGFYIDNICLQGGAPNPPPTVSGLSAVSVGNLTPLFNSSVDNSTSTATVTYTQQAAAENTFLVGNGTGYEFRAIRDTDVVDLHYYRYVAQLTDTSFTLIRGDGTLDTIEVTVSDGLSVYADNGLTMRNDSTVVLGGTLDETTIINSSTFNLKVTGNSSVNAPIWGINTGSQSGIWADNTGTGYALAAVSRASAAAFLERDATSNSTVTEIVNIWATVSGGTAANGFGTKQSFKLEASDNTINVANEITSKWTDATIGTRTSQFIISGVNSAVTGDIAYFNGNGMVGIGSATASATRLNVVDNAVGDASMVTLSSTSTTSSANTQKLLSVSLSGANANNFQTTYAGYFSNTHTGTAAFNRAVYGETSGSSSVGGYFLSTDGIGVVGASSGGSYGVEGGATTGNGVYGHADAGGVGVSAFSTGGVGLSANSSRTGTSDVGTVVEVVRGSSGTAANGLGGSVDFQLEADNGANYLSNQIISKWVIAANATRESQAIITGVQNASTVNLLTLNANGSIQLRPITAAAASAITPAEGMILMVSDTDATFLSVGIWAYFGAAWHAM